jgi:hypothetical protein
VRRLGLTLAILLAAGPTPAADLPPARPVERPNPLSPEARAELRAMLPSAEQHARPGFPHVAMTLRQARHLADVSPKLTWQGEYAGWFVFGHPDPNGGPDPWSGVVFVQKGTNLVGYYRESW